MTFAFLAIATTLAWGKQPQVAAVVLSSTGPVEVQRAETGAIERPTSLSGAVLYAGDVLTVRGAAKAKVKTHLSGIPVQARPRTKQGVKAPSLAVFTLAVLPGEQDGAWIASTSAQADERAQRVLDKYAERGGRRSGAPHPFRAPLEGDRVPVGSFQVLWDAKGMGEDGLVRIEPVGGRAGGRFEAYVPDLSTGRLDAATLASAREYVQRLHGEGRVRLVATVMSRTPVMARSVQFSVCADTELAGLVEEAAAFGDADVAGDAALARSDAYLLRGMISLSSLALEEAAAKADEDWRSLLTDRAANLYERGLSTYRPAGP